MENTGTVVVLITTPSKEIAENIGRHLVEQKLAACANLITPILSIYSWKGEIQQDEETLVALKTRTNLVDEKLVAAVKAIHPYEVPEIIALPVQAGSRAYLDWVLAETGA